MTALIFGAGGQDAHYLAGICRAEGVRPVCVSRSAGDERGDVGDLERVEALVKAHAPDWVFQLAAASTTRHDAVFENLRAISAGSLNVLEAVRRHRPGARVLLAGSGVQFANRGLPISERDPFEASSPYAVARIHAAYAGRYYRSLGLRVYVAYLFHHESPLRKPGHVSRTVVEAARRIAAGSGETLALGDLSVEKEWTFAGEVARALWMLVRQDRVQEAAIGSGVAHPIQAWVERCFALAGADWRRHLRTQEGFRAEYPRLVSDPATIRSLGWSPTVDLDALARMMMAAA
jgi:GDPmannose 4,6-dehydratase